MTIMGKAQFFILLVSWTLAASLHPGFSQTQEVVSKSEFQQPSTIQNQPIGAIRGVVKSGNSPIPGATVSVSSITSPVTSFSTSTDVDGTYFVPIAAYGTYKVTIQMV